MLVTAITLAAIATSFPMQMSLADSGNEVNFSITDNPGRCFDRGTDIAGTRSPAVATPGVRVNFFSGNSNTVHTRTSLPYPTGAAGMPFDTAPKSGELVFENAGSRHSLLEDREACTLETEQNPAALAYRQNPVTHRSM